jgi:hypothetical protein
MNEAQKRDPGGGGMGRENRPFGNKQVLAKRVGGTPTFHSISHSGNSLLTQSLTRNKQWLLIRNTWASMTCVRINNTIEWPENKQSQDWLLQKWSGEALSTMKKALAELTLGRSPMCIWVLINEHILGLDILPTTYVFMSLGITCRDSEWKTFFAAI